MSKGIKISTIILSAVLIFSCATDRVKIAHKVDLTCKTPKTRYDFGKNKPIRAIKSNNSKFTRNEYHATRNDTHNDYSFKNINIKHQHQEKPIIGSGETQNYHILTHSDRNELMVIKPILRSLEINSYHYELKKLPDPARTINKPEGIIISPPQEDILIRTDKANNEFSYSEIVSRQENLDDIMPNESSDDAGATMLNAVKPDQSQKAPAQKSETFILMMAILAGLIPLATIKANPKLAANISFWAAMNPWKTRVMFAAVQIALGTAGVLLGESLADNGVHFSVLSRDLLLGTFLTSSMLYPVKGTTINFFIQSYLKQKAFNLALAISGFMLMVSAGNDPGMRASLTSMVNVKGHEQHDLNLLNDHSQAAKQLVYYQNDKQVQNEQTIPRKKETSRGLKSLYTGLAVLATLVLGCLVAVAACGIYCNGMVGLAFLVGFGGVGLLIGLAIWVIKGIWHPRPKKSTKISIDTDSIPQKGTLQT